MPRRPQDSLPSPDDAESLFADLLDDEVGESESVAQDEARSGASGIPPAIAYQPANAANAPATALDDPDLPYWLALNRVKGIGPARFHLLLEAFGSARNAWEATPSGWQAAGLDARSVASLETQRRRIEPDAEVERLIKLRVGALRTVDPAYPRLLQEIPLPPPVLYVRGTLAPQDEWALAIVGTRRATPYGRQMTEKLAGEHHCQRIGAGHRHRRPSRDASGGRAHAGGARLRARPGLSAGQRETGGAHRREWRHTDGVPAGHAAGAGQLPCAQPAD